MGKHPGQPTDDEQDCAAEAFYGVNEADFRNAVRTILRGFDEGVFVRNIDNDHDSAWAIRLFPFIQAIAVAQQAVGSVARTDGIDTGGPRA